MERNERPTHRAGAIDVQAILAEVEALTRLAERAAAPSAMPARAPAAVAEADTTGLEAAGIRLGTVGASSEAGPFHRAFDARIRNEAERSRAEQASSGVGGGFDGGFDGEVDGELNTDTLKAELDDALEDSNRAVIQSSSGIVHEAIAPTVLPGVAHDEDPKDRGPHAARHVGWDGVWRGDAGAPGISVSTSRPKTPGDRHDDAALDSQRDAPDVGLPALRDDARPELVFDTGALVQSGEDVSRALLETFGAIRPGRASLDDAFARGATAQSEMPARETGAFSAFSTFSAPIEPRTDDDGRTARAIPIALPQAHASTEPSVATPSRARAEIYPDAIDRATHDDVATHDASIAPRTLESPEPDARAAPAERAAASEARETARPTPTASDVDAHPDEIAEPTSSSPTPRRSARALLEAIALLPFRVAALPMVLVPASMRPFVSILAATMVVATPAAWFLAERNAAQPGVGPIALARAPEPSRDARDQGDGISEPADRRAP